MAPSQRTIVHEDREGRSSATRRGHHGTPERQRCSGLRVSVDGLWTSDNNQLRGPIHGAVSSATYSSISNPVLQNADACLRNAVVLLLGDLAPSDGLWLRAHCGPERVESGTRYAKRLDSPLNTTCPGADEDHVVCVGARAGPRVVAASSAGLIADMDVPHPTAAAG